MKAVSVVEGTKPLVLAQPHGGTHVTEEIYNRLNETGRALADTDWHINRLYDGLMGDVTVIQSNIHRYVIDTNRGPDDESLYPGQNTTGLCPTTDFDGRNIYLPGEAPGPDEIKQRRLRYHKPYHDALERQIKRLKQAHKSVVVYDCHSIRSQIPFLFNGKLADFNIGTYSGTSCNDHIEMTVYKICTSTPGLKTVVNGRFKGGWTTRHYGKPDSGVHAIQMELAQSTYMLESPPWTYDQNKSNQLRKALGRILASLVNY